MTDKWTRQILYPICPDRAPEGFDCAMQLRVDMSVNVEHATSKGWQLDDYFSRQVTNQLCEVIAGLAKELEASCQAAASDG